MQNLWKLPPDTGEEVTQLLCSGVHTRIERIVSTGQASPPGFWYDQLEDEWVLLAAGEAVLRFEDRECRLKPGDSLLIPAHVKHRVEFTSSQPPCVWVCVFGSFQEPGI